MQHSCKLQSKLGGHVTNYKGGVISDADLMIQEARLIKSEYFGVFKRDSPKLALEECEKLKERIGKIFPAASWNKVSSMIQESKEEVHQYTDWFRNAVLETGQDPDSPALASMIVTMWGTGLKKSVQEKLTTRYPEWKTMSLPALTSVASHIQKNMDDMEARKPQKVLLSYLPPKEAPQGEKGREGGRPRAMGVCFNCQKPGHIAKFCRAPRKSGMDAWGKRD